MFKKKKFQNQEAQKWWVGKSLDEFEKKLSTLNINLEIIQTDTYKFFFENLFNKNNFSIYWNRTYEPDYLEFDKYLSKNFKTKNIYFKIFKGNILNEFNEVKKNDGSPFKVFTPFWRSAERLYLEKIPSVEKKIFKRKKKISYFKNTISSNNIFPKNQWFKKFEKYWYPSEENALKQLKDFIRNKIQDYSDARNYPNLLGTSKLSPFSSMVRYMLKLYGTSVAKSKKLV